MKRTVTATLLAGLGLAIGTAGVLYGYGWWSKLGSPGPLSAGHADLTCSQCHVDWNTSRTRMDAVCLACHVHDVGQPRDAHSPAYFDIVGLRPMPWYLAPTNCVACHRGHIRPQRNARAMTFMPNGFCVACHADVRQKVSGPGVIASHESFSFASCQTCHQFHGRTLFPPTAKPR